MSFTCSMKIAPEFKENQKEYETWKKDVDFFNTEHKFARGKMGNC